MIKRLILTTLPVIFFFSCADDSENPQLSRPERSTDHLFATKKKEVAATDTTHTKPTVIKTKIEEIKIGRQVWMAENLDVEQFRNGEQIPEARSFKEWLAAGKRKQAAWCYYNELNTFHYGKLYNWYAVTDPRGLAPEGWHVPDDEEWTKLSTFLGGDKGAGTKMKSKTDWSAANGTNESGFNGLPGGSRYNSGDYGYFGVQGRWWSSSESSPSFGWLRYLSDSDGDLHQAYTQKETGLSVRCIRDK
jgi:uncharacterized protein (TIGR02145 family)